MNPKEDITIPALRTYLGHDNLCINTAHWNKEISQAFVHNYQQHVIDTYPLPIQFSAHFAY